MANVLYSNARAKYLENFLLGKDRLFRMVEAASFDDLLKILAETNFGEGVGGAASDIEKVLKKEEENLISFIKDTCPNQAFKEFMLLKNDFLNGEAFIKAKYLKTDPTEMLAIDGIYDSAKMKENVMADEYGDYVDELADAFRKADLLFVSGKASGVAVDKLFKKALYERFSKITSKDKLLKDIFKTQADCQNIAVCLRSSSFAEAEDLVVAGGNYSKNQLKEICETSTEELLEKSKFFPSGSLLFAAVSAVAENKPLSEFEKLSDDYPLKVLKKNKFSTEGIYPFAIYCYYKLAEIKNVRIISVGILNGLEKEEIKRRLRDCYEG